MSGKLLVIFLLIVIFLVSCSNTAIPITDFVPSLTPSQSLSLELATLTVLPTQDSVKTIVPTYRDGIYFGWIHPPFPEVVDSYYEILITPEFNVKWVFNWVSVDKVEMLWLSKSIANGIWQVTDFLSLPNLIGDEVFVPDGCMINNVLISKLSLLEFLMMKHFTQDS